jgi:hypothetical protein
MSIKSSRAVTDVASVKLHVCPTGQVWCANGEHPPVLAAENVDALMETPTISRGKRFRVIASASNSVLIARLFVATQAPIELCTPRLSLTAAEMDDPRIAILRARELEGLPSSMGGWHVMSAVEYVPYALADAIAQKRPESELRNMLWTHPAAKMWSFFRYHDTAALARIVAAIRDPRWYVKRDKPDSLSCVMQYMGMNPQTMAWVLGRAKRPYGPNDRAKLVLNSWQWQPGPTAAQLEDPRNFLWRQCRLNKTHAELRVCKLLMSFLCRTWTDAVVERKGDRLFVPDYFFHDPLVCKAFTQHVESWKPETHHS